VDAEVVRAWTDRCNELGAQGWQLVTAVPVSNATGPGGEFAVYTFMRPLADR
jgi:hypothetical protein